MAARPVKLSLAVQYGMPSGELPRWRLRRWVALAANTVAQEARHDFQAVALTLRLVDSAEGRRLNRDFRQRDYATNVLTFEYGIGPDGTASGDILLCVPVLQREAAEQGKPLLDHAAHLTVHGVLHALGYDHIDPREARAMEDLEIRILALLGLGNPYQL